MPWGSINSKAIGEEGAECLLLEKRRLSFTDLFLLKKFSYSR